LLDRELVNRPVWVDSIERGIVWSGLCLYVTESKVVSLKYNEKVVKDKLINSGEITIKFNYDFTNYYLSALDFITTIKPITIEEVPEFSSPTTESVNKNLPIIPEDTETVEQFFVWLAFLLRKSFLTAIIPDISTVKITDDTK